jgi:hypothetical protein
VAADSFVLGFALTLLLHATLLLGAVWLLERGGVLRHPRWAELAWRGALFGALLSATLASLVPLLRPSAGLAAAARVAATRFDRALPALEAQAPRVARGLRGVRSVRAVPEAAVALPVAGDTPVAATLPPPVAAGGRTPLALPQTAVAAGAGAWLGLTLLLLGRVAWRAWQLRRWRRGQPGAATPPAASQRQAQAIAAAFGLRPPRLRRTSQPSPLALPGGLILLPAWSDALPPPQLRALLAHEIAHLVRRDPAWRIAQQLVLAPLALHPLAWLAQRRLDALAERQADAAAAGLLGDGRPLAECLAQCLAQHTLHGSRAPRLALAMAERPGAVVDRVQRLLEEDPMHFPPPSPRRTRLALALGLLGALALPSIVVTAFADEARQRSSISVHQDDDGREEVDVSIRRGDYALEVEMEGRIEFAADESDVSSMAADAALTLAETREGVARSIEFRPAAGGVAREYRVDGDVRPFDAAGRAWLAQALPELFRNTGIDAEARAKRILARGGSDALLDEIGRIRSDHGRARYLGLLFGLATLDAPQQQRALELAKSIGSDYELRQALAAALASQTLARPQQHQLLSLAGALGSDYERAELLIEASARFTLDPESLALWRGLLADMGSDYEQRRVLEALLAREQDNAGAVRLAFEAAREIGSDYERRQLLQAAIARAPDDAALRHLYLEAAAGIGSDYELKEALRALLRRGPVDAALALATLAAIGEIGSDYECKEALVALAAVMPRDAALVEQYRSVARRLGAYERGEAEKALDRLVVAR